MNANIWRGLLLALTLAAISCSSKKDAEPGSADAVKEQAPVDAPSATESAVQVKDLGKLADLVVDEVNDLPRAEFDAGALAATIGKNPDRNFEWVRDRTYWAPYRGLLRGSKGVMLDRVGSNLDRAVLLGDLLRRAGYTVRLAHAQLAEADARELLVKIRAIPAQRRVAVVPKETPAERIRAMAALIPNLEQEITKEAARAARVRADAEALVASQSEMLLAATREAASPGDRADSMAIDAVRDHWWIERKEHDRWIAMDVLLPDARAGIVPAVASATIEWKAGERFPSIPESSWHSVQLQVVVERYEAGAIGEFTVLEALVRPAEQLERAMTLGHMPLPWPSDLADATDPRMIREAAVAVREWVPYIRVGDDFIVQSGFSIEGELKSDQLDSADLGRVGGAEAVSGMDMALGGFAADETAPAVTAEWLDFEIRVPGSPPERLRRQVFDLLGPARRASKATDFDGTNDLRKLERFEALFSQTDILLQPCGFTDEFVADLVSARIVSNQAAIREISQESNPARVGQLASEIRERMTYWGPLPSFVLWRSVLAGPSTDAILVRPNVLTHRVSQAIVGTDQPRFKFLIDIASNGTATRPGADRSSFEIRVRQGVADTVAEMLALGSEIGMAENTASVFARLAAEGSRALLIRPRDRAAVDALPWPGDEAARVAADVETGYITLVPRKAVLLEDQQRVGWWRVDPVSGETIGVMDNGFHAAGTEDVVTRARAALRVLRAFEKANRAEIRLALQNPNSFPNQKVQFFRRLTRLLYDLDHGIAVL
jgi:hypothetical protein